MSTRKIKQIIKRITKLLVSENLTYDQVTVILKAVRKDYRAEMVKQERQKGTNKSTSKSVKDIFSTTKYDIQVDDFFKKLSTPKPSKQKDKRQQIVKEAKKYLGTKYVYGGASPKKGFDCSGLTQYVFSKKGISISRTTRGQAKESKKIALSKANMGDLVFFSQDGQKISHVGIVNSKKGQPLTMIHASSSKGVIQTNVMNSNYWRRRLMFVRRFV